MEIIRYHMAMRELDLTELPDDVAQTAFKEVQDLLERKNEAQNRSIKLLQNSKLILLDNVDRRLYGQIKYEVDNVVQEEILTYDSDYTDEEQEQYAQNGVISRKAE